MVEIRKRIRRLAGRQGSQTHLPSGTVSKLGLEVDIAYCEDVVGNYPNANYLLIERSRRLSVGTISGQATAFPTYRYSNYPYFSQDDFSHILGLTSPISDTEAVTKAAARTNPSRPTVSMPVFIGEILAELPKSLYESMGDAVRRHPKFAKNTNARSLIQQFRQLPERERRRRAQSRNATVEFNFGIDLFLHDLAQLFKFGEDVENRIKELKALHSPRGEHRRWTVWSGDTQQSLGEREVWSLEGTVRVDVTKTTTVRHWASANWRAQTDSVPSDSTMADQAKLAVHGWNLSVSDVYELMPWSWFIDYFANIGDFLQATRNSVGAIPDNTCSMIQTTTYVTHRVVSAASHWTVTPAKLEFVTKTRNPTNIGITATLPFLGAKQLVTLSSIVLNRSGRVS